MRQNFLLSQCTGKYLEDVGPSRKGPPLKNTHAQYWRWRTSHGNDLLPVTAKGLLLVFGFPNPDKAASRAWVLIYL
jgi:hypothetical protein